MNAARLHGFGRGMHLRGVPLLPKVVEVLIFLFYNSYIPVSASIGKGTVFAYKGIGVVVHGQSRIGSRCIIGQQVTIGGKSGASSPPQIGDRVYIATGAKVLGDITIGDECVIGANAVVLQSVPLRSVVAGVPAKVIRSDIDIEQYFGQYAQP